MKSNPSQGMPLYRLGVGRLNEGRLDVSRFSLGVLGPKKLRCIIQELTQIHYNTLYSVVLKAVWEFKLPHFAQQVSEILWYLSHPRHHPISRKQIDFKHKS